MPLLRTTTCLALCLLLTATSAHAQQNVPRIGYAYPAGGQQGDTFRVAVGGQFLQRTTDACLSGSGVQAKVVECVKPLTPQELDNLRKRLDELRKRPKDPDALKEIRTIVDKLNDFQNRQANPVLGDKVILEIAIAADAEPGQRDLRLAAPNGLSNPLVFQVGQLPEFRKAEAKPVPRRPGERRQKPLRNRDAPELETTIALPMVVNGQVMPGAIDRFQFQARRGQRLVVAVAARELRPYLADAVPGWFQAAVAIRDATGNELAYSDHYHFRPDPALYCKIPRTGQYSLEIRDTLYRGREDFVYRVTIGELPYITGIFPLGGPAGKETAVQLLGCNLQKNTLTVNATHHDIGILPICIHSGKLVSNSVPFAVDSLPECLEQEPNDDRAHAQPITLPTIVNGRIDQPEDVDVFRIDGRTGQKIVAEVVARKLGSPLDSILRLTDANGRQLAVNDDHDDKSAGLLTHHADSLLAIDLPADGSYYLHLGDVQQRGGAGYAYRLRISEPQPDFALLVTPASISVRTGGAIPIGVHVVRRDGFNGEITLSLKNAPKGFMLGGARVPGDQSDATLTLTAPRTHLSEPVALQIEGRATVGGRQIVRQALAAEDMMQAFIYHHLVPAQNLMVAVIGPERSRAPWRLLDKTPIKLVAGGKTSVRFAMPRGPRMEKVQLTLRDAHAGISIQKVTLTSDSAVIVFQLDAEKAKIGQRGNLIVDATVEMTVPAKNAKAKNQKRRVSLGSLPAIPFEIVGREKSK